MRTKGDTRYSTGEDGKIVLANPVGTEGIGGGEVVAHLHGDLELDDQADVVAEAFVQVIECVLHSTHSVKGLLVTHHAGVVM